MRLAAPLALLLALSLAGGTSASFTATTVSPNNLLGTALLSITNDKPNAADLVNLSDLVPGDSATRTVTITNTGTVGFTYTAAPTNLTTTVLWTDTLKGLQVEALRGTISLYKGALKGLTLPASATIAPAGTDTLTFVFSLPGTADNSFQGLSQTFTVTYTATQMAGAAR